MSDPVTVEDLISQMTTTATELQRAQVTVNTAETTIVAKAAQIAAAADTIAAIGPASTSEAGTVQLSNAIDSTDETLAATPKAVKTAYDLANSKYSAQDASTTQKGIVKLNSSVTSTLTSEAATASAVKQAYDLANTANTAVANKYTAQDASTTQKGIVQLSNSTSSTSTTLAATASAVKAAYDLANGKWSAVDGSTSAKGIVQVGTNISVSNGTISVANASTSAKGVVKLNSSTSSTSTSEAATPSAVKSAYDLANGKSTVSFTPTLTSGTKIGTLTIDGVDNDLYCGDSSGGGDQVEGNAGAILYTNANNTAIVMEWDSVKNTHRKVAIAKAAARPGKAAIGTYGKDLSLTNFSSQNANRTWYADGSNSNISQTADCPQITNAEFKRLWANLASDGSMKSNCDVWLAEDTKAAESTSAIPLARAVKIDGVACDIPDEECLIMMFLNAEAIDSLDDTAVSNPTKALGKNANPSGRFVFDGCGHAWSCTEYDSYNARDVHYYGGCGGGNKYLQYAVLPARELS